MKLFGYETWFAHFGPHETGVEARPPLLEFDVWRYGGRPVRRVKNVQVKESGFYITICLLRHEWTWNFNKRVELPIETVVL